jgi:hypothetical protein
MEQNIIQSGVIMDNKIATLKQIKVDNVNWEIFYLDEETGAKWVKEYPHSEMHGGGQAQLRLLDKFPWE